MAEITVNNFAEFESALSGPDYDVIRLGGNINIGAGGVVVPRSKSSVLIDGQGFTVTDYNLAATGSTIRYTNQSGPAMTFTIQNTVWNGKNYFGVVYTADSANFDNFTLVLSNVHYTGPQPVYNRRGTTYFIDSVFNLERNAGASAPEELGEVNRVVIQGTVTVNSQSTTTSVLWFLHTSASLTVEENAVFTVSIPGNYMFYTDGTPPVMLFKANSSTNISTRWGLFYGTGTGVHIASSFKLEAGASFTSTQTDRRGVPTLKVRDTLVLEEGSSLYIAAQPAGTAALVYFAVTAGLWFNNPKSVVLYNNGGNVFQFGAGTAALPNGINIDTELLNIWSSAALLPDAGGFDDPPLRALSKADGSNLNAVINTSTSATTAISSDIADGDAGYPMTPATFNVMQAKVLSMGRLDLAVDTITDVSLAITGVTEPLAALRAAYGQTSLSGTAGAAGAIYLEVSPAILPGTSVTVGSNWKFLTKYLQTVSEGSVTITHLSDLYFKTFFAPYEGGIVKRKDPGWYIEVTDTRIESGPDWHLYVTLPSPMIYDIYSLNNVLSYATPTSYSILSSTPVLIGEGSWSEPGKVTRFTWPDTEGFLLRIDRDYLYHSGDYLSVMYWEVSVG